LTGPLCAFIQASAASDQEEIRRRDRRLGGKRRELDGCAFSAPIRIVIQSAGLAVVDPVVVLVLGPTAKESLLRAPILGGREDHPCAGTIERIELLDVRSSAGAAGSPEAVSRPKSDNWRAWDYPCACLTA
jgi:hypothetical protein